MLGPAGTPWWNKIAAIRWCHAPRVARQASRLPRPADRGNGWTWAGHAPALRQCLRRHSRGHQSADAVGRATRRRAL